MRVLVVENYSKAPVGLFGEYLTRAKDAELRKVGRESLPETPGDEDLLVVLGSVAGAYEDQPWIDRQKRYLAAAVAADRPVVGICFGAQLLAEAIGGRAAPMGRRFAGWLENADVVDPVWRGPWVRWHGDHLTVPEGAEVMARDRGTVQAFQYRRAVGVQFHPEADTEIVRAWGQAAPDWLAENGFDADDLERQSAANVVPRAAARDALFAEMLRRCMD